MIQNENLDEACYTSMIPLCGQCGCCLDFRRNSERHDGSFRFVPSASRHGAIFLRVMHYSCVQQYFVKLIVVQGRICDQFIIFALYSPKRWSIDQTLRPWATGGYSIHTPFPYSSSNYACCDFISCA